MACHVVCLQVAGTTYSLEELVTSYDVEPLEVPISNSGREIRVEAHPDNTGKIFGGEDKHVTLLRYGYILTPTSGPRIYNLHDPATTYTWSKFFVADTNNQWLLVELVTD